MGRRHFERYMVFQLIGEQEARDVASQASIENIDSYEDNIEFYRERNYSYIPLPSEGKYYDIDQNRLVELADNQILRDDTHLITAMAYLRKYPFILLDYHGLLSDQSDLAEKLGIDRDEQERYGIVTVADLNKRRVKEMLYPAVATFENTLAELITQHYPNSNVPESDVNEDAFDRWRDAKDQDLETHIVDHMSLGDIVTVVRNTDNLRSTLGFKSKTQYDDHVGGIVELRNKVMHTRRTLISDPSHVDKTLDRLSRIKYIYEAANTDFDG